MATQIIRLDHRHFVDEPSVIVFKEGDVVYALDTKTKKIISSSTDAATVIQKAIDALPSTGGKVFIKEGRYILSSTLKLKSYTCIKGAGPRITVLAVKNGVPCAVQVFGNSATDRLKRVTLKGFSVEQEMWDGTEEGLWNIGGIYIKYADLLNIDDVYIDWIGGRGIYIQSCWESFFSRLRVVAGEAQYGTEAIRVTDSDEVPSDQLNVNYCSNHLIFDDIIIGGYGRCVSVEGHSNASAPVAIEFKSVRGESPLTSNADYGFYFKWARSILLHGIAMLGMRSNILYARDISLLICSNSYFQNERAPSDRKGFVLNNVSLLKLSNVAIFAQDIALWGENNYPVLREVFMSNCTIQSVYNHATYWLLSTKSISISNCMFLGAPGKYGLHISGADLGVFVENVISSPLTRIVGTVNTFKSTGLSVPIGTGGNYASAVSITSPSGRITFPRVKLAVGGTFGTGETVTVKIEAIYSDESSVYIEKSFTSTWTGWLTDDDIESLIAQGKDIVKLNVYAKSNLATTSVTVTIDAYGKA
jgi:hypothetical protein